MIWLSGRIFAYYVCETMGSIPNAPSKTTTTKKQKQKQNPKTQKAKPNWPMTLQLPSHPKPDSKLGVILCIYSPCTTETEARQYGLEGSFLIKAWLAHITKAAKYLVDNTLTP